MSRGARACCWPMWARVPSEGGRRRPCGRLVSPSEGDVGEATGRWRTCLSPAAEKRRERLRPGTPGRLWMKVRGRLWCQGGAGRAEHVRSGALLSVCGHRVYTHEVQSSRERGSEELSRTCPFPRHPPQETFRAYSSTQAVLENCPNSARSVLYRLVRVRKLLPSAQRLSCNRVLGHVIPS